MKKYRKGFYGILLLTLTMLFGMTAQAKTDDTIKTGIYAGDVELSGMTAQEATAVIEEHIEGLKDVEITLLAANDHDVTTTAGDLGVTWKNPELVQEALELGTHGNVIECRINAEDPEHGFRPSCGRIKRLHIPGGSFVRFDTAIFQDYFIPPYYDSMIGKLIVQARSRELAIRKMKMALSELTIDGIDINRDLLAEILSDEQFVSGEYTTDFMLDFEKKHKDGKK